MSNSAMPSLDPSAGGFFSPSSSANAFNTAVNRASMSCLAAEEYKWHSAPVNCGGREESGSLRSCDYKLQGNTATPTKRDYIGLDYLSTSSQTRKRAAICLGDNMLDATRTHNRDIVTGSDLTLKLAPPGDHFKNPRLAIRPSDDSGTKQSLVLLNDARADVNRQEELSGNMQRLPDCRLHSTASATFSCSGQESSYRAAQAAISHAASARDEKKCSVGHLKLSLEEELAKQRRELTGYSRRFSDDSRCMTVPRKEGNSVPLAQEFRNPNLTESFRDQKEGRNEGTRIPRPEGHNSSSGNCVRSVQKAEYTLNEYDFQLATQIGQSLLQDRPVEEDNTSLHCGGGHIGIAPISTIACTSSNLTNFLHPSGPVPKDCEAQDTCRLSCSNAHLGADARGCGGGSRAPGNPMNGENESPYAYCSQKVIPADQESWLQPVHFPKKSSMASYAETKAVSAGEYNVRDDDEVRSLMTLEATSHVSDQEARHGVDVVGWPPVNSYRKTSTYVPSSAKAAEEIVCPCATTEDKCCFQPSRIKASMDGAWFMRKLNLGSMHGYHDLCLELENLFQMYFATSEMQADVGDVRVDPSFQSERLHLLRGTQYVITYEDTEGDWMLAGDTPWEIFVQSARKIRIMKKSVVVADDST